MAMTDTKSLSERLRALVHDLNRVANEVPGIGAYGKDVIQRTHKVVQAIADALDAKDSEIASLKQIIQDLHYEMRDEADRNE
jgi:uncharacterized protein YoxC